MSNVKLISITSGAGELLNKTAQEIVAYTARASNPANQMNMETAPKLISYLVKNKHWSPLEMVHLTLEITTSRAIAQQIIRHRSFAFQEFSQRYALVNENVEYPARRQDAKNRQNSIDDMSDEDKVWFKNAQKTNSDAAFLLYSEAVQRGIAKEQARFLLPLSTQTKLYMCGSARSWIHYIDLRASNGTQKEHMDLAIEAKMLFSEQLPDIAKAVGWT